MLETTEYIVSWMVYCAAVIGLSLVWWRITRFVKPVVLCQLLRIMVVAPLLVPAPVEPGSPDWAPACFVLLFDMTLADSDEPLRALFYLACALILGLLVVLVDSLFQRRSAH